MKIKVDTIILFVNNVAQVKLFYIDIFNFEIIEEIEAEWVLLNGQGCNIGLHKFGDQYVYNHVVKHENNIKIVFEIEDIVVIRDILISKDAAIGDITTFENYNYWICDGKDPEGNTFQLKQKK